MTDWRCWRSAVLLKKGESWWRSSTWTSLFFISSPARGAPNWISIGKQLEWWCTLRNSIYFLSSNPWKQEFCSGKMLFQKGGCFLMIIEKINRVCTIAPQWMDWPEAGLTSDHLLVQLHSSNYWWSSEIISLGREQSFDEDLAGQKESREDNELLPREVSRVIPHQHLFYWLHSGLSGFARKTEEFSPCDDDDDGHYY